MEHDVNKKLSMKYSPRFSEIAVDMGMVVRSWFEERRYYSQTSLYPVYVSEKHEGPKAFRGTD